MAARSAGNSRVGDKIGRGDKIGQVSGQSLWYCDSFLFIIS
jgi:hypothetical protein